MSAAVVEDRVEAAPASAASNLVDSEHPWLGLDSFSEETRQFFHGREEEIAELARRVQRKTLAILFGQSGLGKTSILRAGIVPRLRREGFCPVYVRIDYSRDSPSPSQQIKQAIFRATEALGKWSRPGTAVPGESLWEFLHHRDDVLRDESGNALVPLLIFDQFEEIFTLGQNDDFGRQRAAEFIQDLADLVENRAPKALEVMIESEDSIAERFDFNRADYRILIALREDYLAHLEGLKGQMPSITQNRMRLARMTGQQALAAVMKPGGKLVTEEVAESIVRFVAGGSELRNAEVEPSLLSLVCRELNNARLAQGRGEISADLMAGSRETILSEFYERALADQPEGVRRFIEDEMLTESGFRESIAEERVLRGFAAAGASPDALSALVNRRLLRIEERLDLRRVELTHDVLCAVVIASRDLRHEREVAAVCAVLAIGAIAGAFFGYVNMKRAQEAEAKALQTRTMADSARGEAEKLIAFLLDDFYVELEPVGRIDIAASLSKRAVDYYAGLPEEIRTPDTQRNRALALVRYGYALRNLARVDEAKAVLTEAVAILEGLYRGGDRSEGTLVGLGLGYTGLARVLDAQNQFAEGAKKVAEGEAILRPAMSGSPSVRARRAYASVTNYLGFSQARNQRPEEALATLETARETYKSIDGLQDLWSAALYAETTGWKMEALGSLGRRQEARRIGEETLPVVTQVLERRPGDMMAMRARALILAGLADIDGDDLRMAQTLAHARAAEGDWLTLVKHDPGNTIAWNNLGSAQIRGAFALNMLGRLDESVKLFREIAGIEKRTALPPGLARNFIIPTGVLAELESDMGIHRPGEGAPAYRRFAEKAVANLPADAPQRELFLGQAAYFDASIAYISGDYQAARDRILPAIRRVEPLKLTAAGAARFQAVGLGQDYALLAWIEYSLGQFAAAERAAREGLRHWGQIVPRNRFEKLDTSEMRILLGMAVARQGRLDEARKLLEPDLRQHRQWLKGGSDDRGQHLLLAYALLGAAVATPEQSRELLEEASAILKRLPPEMSRLKSVARLRGWINLEMGKRPL